MDTGEGQVNANMMASGAPQSLDQNLAEISAQCVEVISASDTSNPNKHVHKAVDTEANSAITNYNFSCSLCDKIFERKEELVSHVCMHDPNVNVLYECQECKTLFQSLEGLAQHMKDHENRRILKNHFKEEFIRITFPCMYCDKTLSSKGSLAKHQELHKGLRPFECTVCGKTFSLKGNMVKHKLIHLGQKPHRCDVCEKTFTLKGNLQRHVLTHTGIKPFHCGKCGKTFTLKGNLDKHLKRHENGTLDKPKVVKVVRGNKDGGKVVARKYNDQDFDTLAEEEEMDEYEIGEEHDDRANRTVEVDERTDAVQDVVMEEMRKAGVSIVTAVHEEDDRAVAVIADSAEVCTVSIKQESGNNIVVDKMEELGRQIIVAKANLDMATNNAGRRQIVVAKANLDMATDDAGRDETSKKMVAVLPVVGENPDMDTDDDHGVTVHAVADTGADDGSEVVVHVEDGVVRPGASLDDSMADTDDSKGVTPTGASVCVIVDTTDGSITKVDEEIEDVNIMNT